MRRRMHCTAGVLCAAGLALASVLSAAAASAGTSARQGTSAAQGTAYLSSAASALPVNYDFATGFAANFASPSASPPGANNFSCHPVPPIRIRSSWCMARSGT